MEIELEYILVMTNHDGDLLTCKSDFKIFNVSCGYGYKREIFNWVMNVQLSYDKVILNNTKTNRQLLYFDKHHPTNVLEKNISKVTGIKEF